MHTMATTTAITTTVIVMVMATIMAIIMDTTTPSRPTWAGPLPSP